MINPGTFNNQPYCFVMIFALRAQQKYTPKRISMY